MSNKIYLVYERIPYQGFDDILHAFLSEKEAEKAVEYYQKEYRKKNLDPVNRFGFMIRDIEESFNPWWETKP